MNRTEFFRLLGVIHYGPELAKHTYKAYKDEAERSWKENLDSAPHGHPWHSSFHGSSFPGGEKSCGRKAIYTLMDIPNMEAAPPHLVATSEIGKAVEAQLIYRWGRAGLLIAGSCPLRDSAPYKQVGFADEDTWLTGALDAVLRLPEWPYVLPVDVKSKGIRVIEAMKIGAQSYYPEHYLQLQAYLYLAHKFHNEMGWNELGLKPTIGGIIYYSAREDPTKTHEFFIDIDWIVINRGIKNLKKYKEYWLNGEIPERPKEWKWTEEPCKWCQFKRDSCKPDWKEKILTISDSNAIKHATKIRPAYSLETAIREVKEEWSVT